VAFGAALMIAQILGVLVLGVLFVVHQVRAGVSFDDPSRMIRGLVDFAVSPTAVISAAAVSSLTLLGTALVGARLAKTPAAVRLRLGPGRLGWGRIAVAVAGAVALSWCFSLLISLTGLDDIGLLHLFDKVFAHPTPAVLALAVLFLGLGAPASEELFFRGFMQTRLAQRWSRAAAIGMTAALFGFMHMDPIQGPFALLAGLYLGWLTEVAGSVRPAIAAHAVNNCLSVFMAGTGGDEPSRTVSIVTLAVAAVVLAAAILVVRSARPRESTP
jgi:membrane protease YdiL (CAAX protease family)